MTIKDPEVSLREAWETLVTKAREYRAARKAYVSLREKCKFIKTPEASDEEK